MIIANVRLVKTMCDRKAAFESLVGPCLDKDLVAPYAASDDGSVRMTERVRRVARWELDDPRRY